MLVSDLINLAFLDGNLVAAGETPNPSEYNDSFARLNTLVDSLNAEGATLPSRQIDTYAMSTGLTSFTMGPPGGTGTLSTNRPTRVLAARCYSGAFGRGLKVITDPMEWAALTERGSTFTMPLILYVDYQLPNAMLHVIPAPQGAGISVTLDVLEVNATFAPDTPAELAQMVQTSSVRRTYSINLTSGVGVYPIGPTATGTGSVVGQRPAKVFSASVSNGTFKHELKIVGSAVYEQQLEPDNTALVIPLAIYPVYSYPNATMNFWPPPGAGVTAEIQSPQQIPQFTSLAQDLGPSMAQPIPLLPPAWLEMLHFGLSVKLYPEYRRNQGIPQELIGNAVDAKKAVIDANIAAGVYVPPQAQAPPAA